MPPDLRLRVNGAEYGGWKTVRVTRGIECVAGKFELSVSDRWAEQATPWPIVEEDECALVIDGIPIITGYVDRRSLAYAAEEHSLSVTGRDRTCDMVDCSAILSKWEYLDSPLLTLAKRLAEPFGVKVSVQPGLLIRTVSKLTIDPGDTAFDALERACRLAGVLPVSDGLGGLLLTRAGSTRATTALVEGENILGAGADYDASGRFRRYVVMGQHPGNDQFMGESASTVQGSASDPGVRRAARVLVVRPEGAVDPGQARLRAQWEAKVRAGRADTVTVRVQGWKQGDGTLWPVNARVNIRSPYLGVNGEMLITQATYALDDRAGTTTELALKRPDAFLPEPVVTSSGLWKEISTGVTPVKVTPDQLKSH